MPTDQDWAPAVKKLVALTESGELAWQELPDLSRPSEEILGAPFLTAVQNRLVAVYEYRFRSYQDEDTWTWANDVAIEFVTEAGELQWRWPATPYRWALIDAIRSQRAKAPEFLRDFLAEGKAR